MNCARQEIRGVETELAPPGFEYRAGALLGTYRHGSPKILNGADGGCNID